MDTFEMIATERRALADEMDGWSDEQWQTPSLCGAWTVREVAAHLIVPFTVTAPKVLLRMISKGFDFNRANDELAREEAAKPTGEIVETLRANAEHRFTPPFNGPEAPLTDVIVHGQDMRRPLGIDHRFEPDHLRCSLDWCKGGVAGFVPKKRVVHLRFEATDLDWSSGPPDADVVSGPAEAILLALTGRAAALDDLGGGGVATLRDRLR